MDVVSLTLLAAFVFTCSKALVSCLWELPMRCGQDRCGRIGGSRTMVCGEPLGARRIAYMAIIDLNMDAPQA